MRPRLINYLRHLITGKQALSIALECWQQDKNRPIILVTEKGDALNRVKTMRVELSRAKNSASKRVEFGFTVSDAFPYSDAGHIGEAILLYWKESRRQQVLNRVASGDFEIPAILKDFR